VALVSTVLFTVAIRHVKKHAQKEREIAYQASLRSYSKTLRPGMTRKQVENYLQTNNVKFQQMCCIHESSAFC